jgi:hypothetical protein
LELKIKMKITQKNPSYKKPLIITVMVIAIFLIGISTYVLAFKGNFFGWTLNPKDSSETNQNFNTDPPTPEQIQDGNNIKKEAIDNSSSNTNTDSDKVSMSVTAIQQSGTTVKITAIISKVTSSGTCALTMTREGSTVTKSAGIQALSSYATCKGYDIPTSSLSTGIWNVVVKYSDGTNEGSASTNVTIN